MSAHLDSARNEYANVIQNELTKLGLKDPTNLKSLQVSTIENLAKEYLEKRNLYRYGPHYGAYDYLYSICLSSLPLFGGRR